MIVRRILFGIACGLWIIGAVEMSALAATSQEDLTEYTRSAVNRGSINLAQDSTNIAKESIPSGNPLWGIPLSSLSITRERPIFTPSRRPPAPAIVAVPHVAPVKQVIRQAAPQQLNLVLIGTVVRDAEGIGVFIDQTTKELVRIRIGEGYSGWVLRSVRTREATLEKEHQSETLSLPGPGGNSPTR